MPNGNYSMTFKIYDALTVGTLLCTDTDASVAVSNGLFSATIDGCSDVNISGTQLYLGITVGADAEMTPRQKIGSVPYARSLRPGADIRGSDSSALLYLVNSGTAGSGVYGNSTGASGTTYGVHGDADSPSGYGGYFSNSGATSGAALYANGDAKQLRTGDGFVKAGVYVNDCGNGTPTITRSFNNVDTTAITVTAGSGIGRCTIDFGFQVNDRYIVVTAANVTAARTVTWNSGADNEKLDFFRFDDAGNGASGDMMVLIY